MRFILFYGAKGKNRIRLYAYKFHFGYSQNNERHRKKLVSVEVSSIIDMQPITADNFQKLFNDNSVRKVNMFLNKGTHLYYMLIVKDGKKVAIVFEPDQQLIEYMKLFNPENIIA